MVFNRGNAAPVDPSVFLNEDSAVSNVKLGLQCPYHKSDKISMKDSRYAYQLKSTMSSYNLPFKRLGDDILPRNDGINTCQEKMRSTHSLKRSQAL